MKLDPVINNIKNKFGDKYIPVKLVEEMAELTHPLCKQIMGTTSFNPEKVLEEIAHVKVFIELYETSLSENDREKIKLYTDIRITKINCKCNEKS
jgi:hypothetical protein